MKKGRGRYTQPKDYFRFVNRDSELIHCAGVKEEYVNRTTVVFQIVLPCVDKGGEAQWKLVPLLVVGNGHACQFFFKEINNFGIINCYQFN
jgi:hypothetical protein